jgi:hypothetical protein
MRVGETEFIGDQEMSAANVADLVTCGADVTSIALLKGQLAILLRLRTSC